MRKKHLKSEKHCPFFFYLLALFPHDCLHSIKKHLLSRNPHPVKPIDLHYKSIDWIPYDRSSQCNVFPKKH